MGQAIGFRILTHDKFITKGASGVPDHFTDRFQGRWDWFNAVLDTPHEYVKDCGCGEGKCYYGCSGDAVFRPTNFQALRSKLGPMVNPPTEENQIFREITDWLEAHPDVYVEFS